MEEKEEAGIRGKEWGVGRLNGKQESDLNLFISLAKEFQGDPSEGSKNMNQRGQDRKIR